MERSVTTSDTFEQQLRQQLGGAPPGMVYLMGELLFFHQLVAGDLGGVSKRATISTALSWSPASVAAPADLAMVLDRGLAKAGIAFKTSGRCGCGT